MPTELLPAIFTLDIGAKPILSFEARNLREAQEICHEAWLREDMAELKSNDVPLWDGRARIRARYASEAEMAAYRKAAPATAQTPDEILLAFLVKLDGRDHQDRLAESAECPPNRA
jgi:hypothetical protein